MSRSPYRSTYGSSGSVASLVRPASKDKVSGVASLDRAPTFVQASPVYCDAFAVGGGAALTLYISSEVPAELDRPSRQASPFPSGPAEDGGGAVRIVQTAVSSASLPGLKLFSFANDAARPFLGAGSGENNGSVTIVDLLPEWEASVGSAGDAGGQSASLVCEFRPKIARSCHALAFSGGNKLAIGYAKVRGNPCCSVYDLEHSSQSTKVYSSPSQQYATADTVSAVCWAGPHLLGCGSASKWVRFYDTRVAESAAEVFHFKAHANRVCGLTPAPHDPNLLASYGDQDEPARLWDVRRLAGEQPTPIAELGAPLANLPPITGVAFCPWRSSCIGTLRAGAAAMDVWDVTAAGKGTSRAMVLPHYSIRTRERSAALRFASWSNGGANAPIRAPRPRGARPLSLAHGVLLLDGDGRTHVMPGGPPPALAFSPLHEVVAAPPIAAALPLAGGDPGGSAIGPALRIAGARAVDATLAGDDVASLMRLRCERGYGMGVGENLQALSEETEALCDRLEAQVAAGEGGLGAPSEGGWGPTSEGGLGAPSEGGWGAASEEGLGASDELGELMALWRHWNWVERVELLCNSASERLLSPPDGGPPTPTPAPFHEWTKVALTCSGAAQLFEDATAPPPDLGAEASSEDLEAELALEEPLLRLTVHCSNGRARILKACGWNAAAARCRDAVASRGLSAEMSAGALELLNDEMQECVGMGVSGVARAAALAAWGGHLGEAVRVLQNGALYARSEADAYTRSGTARSGSHGERRDADSATESGPPTPSSGADPPALGLPLDAHPEVQPPTLAGLGGPAEDAIGGAIEPLFLGQSRADKRLLQKAQLLHEAAELFELTAMCVAGFRPSGDGAEGDDDPSAALWRSQCRRLLARRELEVPLHPLNLGCVRGVLRFLVDASDPRGREALRGDPAGGIFFDKGIALSDRVAFAALYLPGAQLRDFLARCGDMAVREGDIEGLCVTGINERGLGVLRAYVDRTGDAQTVCLTVARVLPHRSWSAAGHALAEEWIGTYRELLNRWRLWTFRAKMDVGRSKLLGGLTARRKALLKEAEAFVARCRANRKRLQTQQQRGAADGGGGRAGAAWRASMEEAMAAAQEAFDAAEARRRECLAAVGEADKFLERGLRFGIGLEGTRKATPNAQMGLSVRCSYCNAVFSLAELRPTPSKDKGRRVVSNRAGTRLASSWLTKQKDVLPCCPSCRKPLPRCYICMLPMGCLNPFVELMPHRPGRQGQGADLGAMPAMPMKSWFMWCQSCLHGGHAACITEWFRTHKTCGVGKCNCTCELC